MATFELILQLTAIHIIRHTLQYATRAVIIDLIRQERQKITFERLAIDNHNETNSGIRRYLHSNVTTRSDIIKHWVVAIFKRIVAVNQ